MTPVVLTPEERKVAGIVMEKMIPPEYKIPAKYWEMDMMPDKPAYLFICLFFQRVKSLDLDPRPGIDATAAWDHLTVLLKSWEPDYRHKAAAWTYLFDQWFERYYVGLDWKSLDAVQPKIKP